MDGMTLLLEAQAAGLAVSIDGDKLVIRGPRKAEAIALRILEHKPAVMAALLGRQTSPSTTGAVCPRCGSTEFIDIPIHNGRSTRRDCAKCGKFINFPRWYENLGAGRN